MFSFSFAGERYVQPHTYIAQNEEPEEEMAEAMDTTQKEQAPFEQFNFSASKSEEVLENYNFKKEWIPKTLLPFPPNVLNGLEAIDDLTAGQKCVLCVYNCLPMPVVMSPIMILLLDNLPRGAQRPQKRPYLNWVQSAFQLRSLVLLVHQRATPFHSSVTNEYPQECHDEMLEQIASYEALHQERLQHLFENETPDYMERFIAYLEDFSWYYLHTLERFLYKTLIEPHGSDIQLEHVLTPKTNLNAYHADLSFKKCVADFFALHVEATHKHEQRHAGPDYVQKNTFNLADIPRRLTTTPPQDLYHGYVDRQTMQEYYWFSK